MNNWSDEFDNVWKVNIGNSLQEEEIKSFIRSLLLRELDKRTKEIYKQFGVDLDEPSNYTKFDGTSITIKKDLAK